MIYSLIELSECPRVALWTIALTAFAIIEGIQSKPAGRSMQGGEFNGMDYLANYGYLGRANLETGALRSKVELETAVRQFQKMAGLRQTGELDQTTLAKMKTPRCGIADLNSTSNGPQSFALGPSKWEKTDITYSIKSWTPDLYWGDVSEAVAQAFQIWSDVSPLTFRDLTNQRGEADIQISFAPGYHDDGYSFDGKGNVLAHAFAPGNGRGGDAHFDEDESWTVKIQTGTNLYTVAAHEFGHSLGIYHSNVQGALMYPWYQGFVPDLKLSSDDIAAIQKLYGARRDKPPPRTNPPTRSDKTVTPPIIPTHRPTTRRPPSDDKPEPCSSDVDAVSKIRGELFAFKGKYFWRMNREGKQVDDSPALIRDFWGGLPPEIADIDALYERRDNKIVFFRGNRFWELDGLDLAAGCPRGGRPLTDYGLDAGVTHVDAIFVWGLNQRTYIFSGYSYWRMDREGVRVERGYPRPTDMWTGIPIPFDTVFTHPNGKTYFIKGHEHWSFNDQTMRADIGYPKRLRELWTYCPQNVYNGFPSSVHEPLGTLFILTVLAVVKNVLS